jgi:hypothetical protein
MKKLIITLAAILALTGCAKVVSAQNVGVVNDKDLQGSLPDPDRDYFDQCGSKFDYLGNLKEKGTGCTASPRLL